MGDVLVHLHGLLLVHCLRALGRLGCRHCGRGGQDCCLQDLHCSGDDCDLLVHLPSCLLVPNVGHLRRQVCCLHPDRLLRLRHHLQVRCWPCDLPDHLRQVPEGVPPWLKHHLKCLSSYHSFSCCGCSCLRHPDDYI